MASIGNQGEIVAYHGTSKENADKIISSGYFKKGTWFTEDTEAALIVGGPFLFTVKFNAKEEYWTKGEIKDNWQFFLRDPYSTDNVIETNYYGEKK